MYFLQHVLQIIGMEFLIKPQTDLENKLNFY